MESLIAWVGWHLAHSLSCSLYHIQINVKFDDMQIFFEWEYVVSETPQSASIHSHLIKACNKRKSLFIKK